MLDRCRAPFVRRPAAGRSLHVARALGLVPVGALLAVLAPRAATAQIATFDSIDDSITFAPVCISVPNRITYEAVLRIAGPQAGASGNIYNEIRPWSYDRQFGITGSGLYEYTHPVDGGTAWHVPAALAPDVWHHVAYCYDGSEQRFYLDGTLISSRARSGNIESPCAGFPSGGNAGIGRVARGDGSIFSSFRGSLQSLRISSIARYSGPSFTPPPGDLSPDADTMLLFNFDECDGVAAADDAGPLGHDGTIGGGGGSRPTFSRVCCPADLDDDGNFANAGRPDGAVTIEDLLYFLVGFEAGDVAVDLDDDGAVDIDDLLFFLPHYEGGC